MIYSVLLLLAIWLCRTERRMLLLTLLVGLSHYLPVEYITNRSAWFSACIAVETSITIIALYMNVPARLAIFGICSMLTVSHLISWVIHTNSTYYQIVQVLEHLELVPCIIFSNPIIQLIKERVKRCLPQKF